MTHIEAEEYKIAEDILDGIGAKTHDYWMDFILND